MWTVFGLGSNGGSDPASTAGGAAAANGFNPNAALALATERRICSCHFVPGLASGFRACRCTTRCTPPVSVHPATGWLNMLFDGTKHIGFKYETLPVTTTLDITPQTELTRDLVITFPGQSTASQTLTPNEWRSKLFPPQAGMVHVHPTHPVMPLVIELLDYTSTSALDLTITTQHPNGGRVSWLPRGGTCIVEGDGWRATDGVFLPPQPGGGGGGSGARRLLYVYDAEECSRPSTRACLTIDFEQLRTDIIFTGRDTLVSHIKMPPTLSPIPIRDPKQLFALCVAREIARTATKPSMEVSSLVREVDQAQGASCIVLPHFFKTAVELRRPGTNNDLLDLLDYWKDRAGHARRCFEASSNLVISATPIGQGGFIKPITLHLRFTYVTVPRMIHTEPSVAV